MLSSLCYLLRFCGMFRSNSIENGPSIRFSLYELCKSVSPYQEAFNDDTPRVCVTTSLELASLQEYLHNADKSCGSNTQFGIAMTNFHATKGSTLIQPYGGSRFQSSTSVHLKLSPAQSFHEFKHHHGLCTIDETTHRNASVQSYRFGYSQPYWRKAV